MQKREQSSSGLTGEDEVNLMAVGTVESDVELAMREAPGDVKRRAAVHQTTEELANLMRITSICGLGRGAAGPLTTWLEYFKD